eukprot:gnl/MRDRNA2_/MRDRNA2_17157_c0_seq1.p1 gnl/MRDRNA2_/MRDRNA2_17157_c0~~gnl/MRDRNA2_/MRDRNA2_17157_c0_seq1.p1  ORF type:complete len:288 (+),score=64.71 gnl/MRDRNA2_/MRDRNA2_17157_c0_seq1:72-935(+)
MVLGALQRSFTSSNISTSIRSSLGRRFSGNADEGADDRDDSDHEDETRPDKRSQVEKDCDHLQLQISMHKMARQNTCYSETADLEEEAAKLKERNTALLQKRRELEAELSRLQHSIGSGSLEIGEEEFKYRAEEIMAADHRNCLFQVQSLLELRGCTQALVGRSFALDKERSEKECLERQVSMLQTEEVALKKRSTQFEEYIAALQSHIVTLDVDREALRQSPVEELKMEIQACSHLQREQAQMAEELEQANHRASAESMCLSTLKQEVRAAEHVLQALRDEARSTR